MTANDYSYTSLPNDREADSPITLLLAHPTSVWTLQEATKSIPPL